MTHVCTPQCAYASHMHRVHAPQMCVHTSHVHTHHTYCTRHMCTHHTCTSHVHMHHTRAHRCHTPQKMHTCAHTQQTRHTHMYTHQTHTPCTCNAHPPCTYTHVHMHSSHIHQVSELFRGSLLEPTFLFYPPAGVEGKVQTQGLKVFTHRAGFLPRPSVFGSRSRGVTRWGSRFSGVKQNPSTSRRKRQSCEWRPVRGSGVSANACFFLVSRVRPKVQVV